MWQILARATCCLLLPARLASAQLVFEPQVSCSPVGETYSPRMDLGDVDGDGDRDLVVFTGADSLFFAYEVLLNDGTGTLVPTSKVSVPQVFSTLRLADLDADLVLDLVSAHGNTIRLRRGLGDGSFGASEVVYTPSWPTLFRFEVAELTGDTWIDLVALQGGVVEVLPGLGDGSVGAPIPVADLGAQAAYGARVADLDGDGATDLVILARDSAAAAGPTCLAHVFMAAAPGAPIAFTAQGSCELGANADLVLALLDDDAHPDLASSSSAGLAVQIGLGTGDFLPPSVIDSSVFDTGLAAEDFDGDGDFDLASVSPASKELVFWQRDGQRGYVEGLRVSGADAVNSEGESPLVVRPLQAADMNGDGRPDLVREAGNTFGQVRVNVFRNHTYGPGATFLDLGCSLSDPGWSSPGDLDVPGMFVATPILLADGSLQVGTEVRLRVFRHGVESDHAWLVLGFHSLFAPLQGGTLVPACDALVGPLILGSSHAVADLVTTMPAGVPTGFQFWLQAWFVPGDAFQDYAATSAVCATAP